MKFRNSFLIRSFALCFLCGGLLFVVVSASPSLGEEPSARDQEISAIERQIAELQKKLDQLRKGEQHPPAGAVEGTLPDSWTQAFHWRCIGPAAMGGRIVALSVFEADSSTWWVATASGGLLKTTNNGTTFEHQFDRESTVSIGDVAVAPSDRNIVWVGTGENNPRNSVSYGDGVYKSTDGGKTWKNMGLKKTFQIGRIAIHPTNPDIVYVGALGRLYGPNEDRGVFKTTDGGKTWEKVLYLDDRTGIIDMRIDPSDPQTVYAAGWERQRDGFDSHPGREVPVVDGYDGYDPMKKWGSKGGIYKTTDGGHKWTRLTTGLPSCDTGRIGLDMYAKNPKTLFAIIDCAKIGMGTPPSQVYLGIQGEDAEGGIKITAVTPNSPVAKANIKTGDVIKAFDKDEVKGLRDLTERLEVRKPGDKVTLTIQRDKEVLKPVVTLEERPTNQPPMDERRLTTQMLGAFGEDVEGGVRLRRVADEGPAGKAGLKSGDLVKAVDKKPVKTFKELAELLAKKKPGDKVTLQVARDNATEDHVVTLGAGGPGRGPGGPTALRPYSFSYGGQRENMQNLQGPNSQEYGGLYKSSDAGETWTRINSINPRPMYFSQVRVDPSDEKYLYVLGINLYRSSDGGKSFKGDGGSGVHPDQHALWIDPRDGRHMIVGCDGGFYATYDRMQHWDFLNHMAIGQFYHVCVDSSRPYRAFGGLQDNGSWGGPSHSLSNDGPINEDWMAVSGGDGFVCRVDPTDPDLVYFESQDGNIGRRNLKTGEGGRIRLAAPNGKPPYRFNWNTPFILSSHNPRIFYSAGNYVFRSIKRGDDLRVISPEITRTKRGSGTALAESPRNPDVLWVGTDDGNLWVTRDGGIKWANLTDKITASRAASAAGLPPAPRWVASIEPSRYREGRCYVVLDAHRSDDDEPYVLVTEDFGESWKSLRSNLPSGSTRVLREDIKNEELLYLGTEFGAWASLNRGKSWTKISNNLPTVAVHELAQHPTAGEIVAATHGRSLWVLDVSALRQMKPSTPKDEVKLFEPMPAVRWRSEPERGSAYGTGSRHFIGENPPRGAEIYFALAKKAEKGVSMKIVDFEGKSMSTVKVENKPGLQRVNWGMSRAGGFGRSGGAVPPGMYKVVLTVDGKEYMQPLRVEADPVLPATILAVEEEEPMREKD